ncbi:MAG: hypothetical protein IKU17_03445, partial [Clostridia bacterium]|nr:hypothetical protein [Clostridia bacterium]
MNSVFRFTNEASILAPEHLAVSGNRVNVRTPYNSATMLEALQAPPYANTDFWCEVKIGGESVPGCEYTWQVNLLERRGQAANFSVVCRTAIPPYKNAVVQAITVKNTCGHDLDLPFEFWYRGCTEYVQDWVFSPPAATCRAPLHTENTGRVLTAFGPGDAAFAVTCSEEMEHFALAGIWKTRIVLPAGESRTVYFSVHSGCVQTVRE